MPQRTAKVVFINPGLASKHPFRDLKRELAGSRPYGMRPLAAGILKSLTPKNKITYIDDNAADTFDWNKLMNDGVNMVALTVLTHNAPRAYEIAAQARAHGMQPVLGGWHPTLMPEEAKQHGTVVRGEAYLTWKRVIRDFEAMELKGQYAADRFASPDEIVSPDRSIYPGINHQVIATTGCKYSCTFCCMAAFYKGRMAAKQVKQVVNEIEGIGEYLHRYSFADDNMSAFPEATMEIFSALAASNAKRTEESRKKLEFFAFMGVEIGDEANRALLETAQRAGLYRAHMGIESLNAEALRSVSKKANLNGTAPVDRYRETFRQLHKRGISSYVAAIFGFDQDTQESIYAMRDFLLNSGVSNPIFSILTPYPGTPFWRKLQKEGRIIDTDYSNYDMAHLVFEHPVFSKPQLENMYWECWSFLYYPENTIKRLLLNSEWIKTNVPSERDLAQLVEDIEREYNDNLLDDSDLPQIAERCLAFVDTFAWLPPPLVDRETARVHLARDVRSNIRNFKRLTRRLHPQLFY